jgi:glycosyltransferase involved in cell wall biosynthesis
MSKAIKVTVILTSYNHEKTLQEAIDSVLHQTFSNFELIILDDVSVDYSWQIIESYTDPRIKSFRNDKNRRANYGINKAIKEKEIQGEYIAIHHSDDIWEHDKLEKQVRFLEENPQIGAVFTWAQIIDEEGKSFEDESHLYYKIFEQPNRTRDEWLNHFFYVGNALCHPSVLVRKEVYEQVGLYRYGMAQLADFDMWVRLAMKFEIHVIQEKLSRFRVHQDEVNTSGNRPDVRVRMPFEYLQILENYRTISDFSELKKIFPEVAIYERKGDEDLGFALGMISLQDDRPTFTQLFGLTLLFEILNDFARSKKVEELYGFTQKDFIKLSAKYDVFSVETIRTLYAQLAERDTQLAERDAQLAERDAQLAERDAQLHEIKISKTWRAAIFLRRARVFLIPPNSLQAKIVRRVASVILFTLKFRKREEYVAQPVAQFLTSSGFIDMSKNKKSNNTAVILHLFYEELFEEIETYLINLHQFDLYISMPKSISGLKDRIFASYPDARIFFTENRGRDISPFIIIYKNISSLDYNYLLKIHTKKSPHREDGDTWRADVFRKLLGSSETIDSAMSAFENNPEIGVIGPKGHVIDYRIYWGSNKKKTEELASRAGVSVKKNYSFNFVAGSMFWAKPKALRHLSLLTIKPQEYEPEPLGPDGALVHALERFIGLIVEKEGYSIYELDDQGNVSNPKINSPSDLYPFGVADEKQIIAKENTTQLPNYLVAFMRKAYSVGKRLYHKRGRVAKLLIEWVRNPRASQVPQKILQSVHNEPELTEHLAEILQKSLADKKYVVSISHSDYTTVVGGVEIMIMDEQKDYNNRGITYLQLFPFLMPNPRLLSENEPLFIGINCDGKRIGVTDRNGLLLALNQINVERLLNIVIHHMMGFDPELINRILKDIGGQKGRFWLHDNFSICPGYTLLRNDLAYCNAPDIDSKDCLSCKHGKNRGMQQAAFVKLFKENDLEVVAPSSFILNLWKDKASLPAASGKVIPHLYLNWTGTKSELLINAPLRIGFIGYPVYWKGWDTWLRLIKNFSKDPRYQFYCFTSWPKTSGKMKWVSVSVTKNDRLAMVKSLGDNKIDIAFLWSLCPETFSFTLYEALAAGCYILTYKNSGNIQAYLNERPNHGLVLKEEKALLDLFSGDDLHSLIADYQKNGKPQGELSFYSEFNY